MYAMKMFLPVLLLAISLFDPWLGVRQRSASPKRSAKRLSITKSQLVPAKARSVVGIYFKVITADRNGNIWVAGSVWLQQGLLLRHNGQRIIATTLPYASTLTDLVFTGPLTGWMIANHNYLYRTRDGGATWQLSLKVEANLTSICFSDVQHGWVAGWHGIIFNTADGGASWRAQHSGTQYDFKKIQFVDALYGWAIGGKFIGHPLDKWMPVFVATDDGGRTWKSMSPSRLPDVFQFVNEREGWGVDAENNILQTTDGGETWEIQHNENGVRLSSIYFLNEHEGWVAGDEVLHTDDGGETWSWINENSELPGKLDHIVFRDSSEGWGIEKYGSDHSPRLLRSTDGGKTWRVVADNWKDEVVENVYRAKFGPKR